MTLEDKVQWFRAWAETMRWMEEFELKHMEITRCIRSFRTMSEVWEGIASKSEKPGYGAFARRQSDIYSRLCKDAEELFAKHAEPQFVYPETTLIDALCTFREEELSWFRELALGLEGST